MLLPERKFNGYFVHAKHDNGVRLKMVSGLLPSRLIEFYTANPDRELTYVEACAMFNCKRTTLSMALKKLTESGYLETPRVIRIRAPKKGQP